MNRCNNISVHWTVGIVLLASIAASCISDAQQISIARIELMPNKPSPYLMRNWNHVAVGYDSLVFNQSLTGTYLPLVSVSQNFSLSSYVGQLPSQTKEAINCIPAVVSASLVGVDKTNQFGYNWVSACQDWFNQNPGEDVYLNSPGGSSGSDWWYDMMPNVFFYQLYSMYPSTGNFQNQFVTVSNRWLAALNAMGAGTTPWKLANLSHTAWDLSTMTPTNSGWVEPEAGGTIALLLYSAYVQTGKAQYRVGAELAMESLLSYQNTAYPNPSYELQLPYGAYIAARMNAELGTTYDMTKIVNWCFSDGSDNSRLWGVTVGKWGGYDCDGLIGETGYGSGNAYPFVMNTFEEVGALVPMVRYDPRFARSIGKWVLNAANAARLFYTNYLPDQNQDGASWSHQYDPQSLIAHESMRQKNGSTTPYATGDAIGNSNPTNFALYGSSHVGIFGGIIDTTDVPMILRLDVLKTDYFHAAAYPTFLLFSPDSIQHSVSFDAGPGQHDLYDAVSHSYILTNVSGVVGLPISANSAILVVNTPASVTPTYNLDQMLIDGTVVDYHSGHAVANYPPRIKSLTADSSTVLRKHSTFIFCTATDKDNDTLSYSWNSSGGSVVGSGAFITWSAPDTVGTYVVRCIVGDTHGAQVTASDTISVVQLINHPPVIQRMKALPGKIDLGATSTITCFATDPDSNALTYRWSAARGLLSGAGSVISWQAPQSAGNYYIQCTVDDSHGGTAVDSAGLEVRDFSYWQTGNLVAYYPFNGNTNDASGNHHDGTASGGGSFTSDRFGHINSAYAFDGATASINVPNDSALNFQNGITVNFWMTVGAFYPTREQYPISHGSWQNSWKFSISPNTNTLRWTVRNSQGVPKDLDCQMPLLLDSLYNVTGTYNGSDLEIYLNGQLDAFTSFSGSINTTTSALTIGRDLTIDNNYDFDGVLDDIRIYNYMLPVSQISAFYDVSTAVGRRPGVVLPTEFSLSQNFPNPFNPSTTIRFALPSAGFVTLKVFDVLGREVATLVRERVAAGEYSVAWNGVNCASGVYYYKLETVNSVLIKKMILLR